MNSNFFDLTDDSSFNDKLIECRERLLVVDFYANWCGPCTMIAPFYKQLSVKFSNVAFLKVDVDKCPGTAAAINVTAMPTFVFFFQRREVDRLRGADKNELEKKIKENIEKIGTNENASDSSLLEGEFIDLVNMINKSSSECLNQADDHPWENILSLASSSYLQSDVDEQLLLFLSFTQPVKINSIVIKGPSDKGPKNIRLFINQTRTLDFESAENCQSVQDIELNKEDLSEKRPIKLRFVKFQNVQNITIFFVNNQSENDITQVDYLKLIGSPLNVTNMNDFKRVSGQAGESHG